MLLTKEKIKTYSTDFYFQEELNSILLFVSELCEVPHAYIAISTTAGFVIKTGKDFAFSTLPDNISLVNDMIIETNTMVITSNTNSGGKATKEDVSYFPYIYFAGLPICVTENDVIGTLCLIDNSERKLSSLQIKSLEHAVSQIKSLIKLNSKNKELEDIIKSKEKQFELHCFNSNEIFFELSMEGIFIFSSDNWVRFLGHSLNEVLGKSLTDFIHPEDLEKCNAYLRTVTREQHNRSEITYRIAHKLGYYVWYTSHITVAEKEGIRFFCGNCRDVTDTVISQKKESIQKEFYEKILDQLPTDVAVFNRDHKYIYLNAAAIKNDALRKFIIGRDDFEYANHTGRDNAFAKKRRKKFIHALSTKKVIEWEDPIRRADGQITIHRRKFAPVFLEDGSLEMMIGFGVDITESKYYEEEILKSRLLTKNIIQNAAVGILVQGPQSAILDHNIAVCEMLGLSADELNSKSTFDADWKVIHVDGTDFLPEERPLDQAIRQKKPVTKIVMGVHRTLQNDLVWLLVDAIPVFDDANELLYVICTFNDITALKKAEDALKISHERFIHAGTATSDTLWDWNIVTDEMYVGDSFYSLLGRLKTNSIKSMHGFTHNIHKVDKAPYTKSLKEAINSTNSKWSFEYRLLKADGTYSYVNDKATIIRNSLGQAIQIIGAIHDVTIEKKIKDELQLSEQRFRGAFEHSYVGMAIVDIDGYWIDANNRLCEILGYSKQELEGMTFEELTYIDDLPADLSNRDKLIQGLESYFSMEKRYIHKSGLSIWVNLYVSVVKNEKGEILHFISQIIDISERKKMELENKRLIDENNYNKAAQLERAEYMYRLLAENTADLICLHSLDSTFEYVSPSVSKILGYNPDDLVHQLPELLVHPDDSATLNNTIQTIVNEKKDVSINLRLKNHVGEYKWFESKVTVIRDSTIPIRFQSSSRDISERRKAEKVIENTLIQERELNELRTNLVSTISHEFRTPMTTIRTSAEMISMYLESQDLKNSIQVEKRIYTIIEEIDRIVELMNAVLTISKNDSGKTSFNPAFVDLKKICQDLIDSSYSDRKDKRKIQTIFTGNTFKIFADKNLIEFAVSNILNNAFKYSEGSTDVLLTLVKSKKNVVLEIIDFGMGIPDKDLSKLFNTFFRASNTDGIQGTGLGLYIVKTFIEKNSGTVGIQSEIGKGTKVTCSFPI